MSFKVIYWQRYLNRYLNKRTKEEQNNCGEGDKNREDWYLYLNETEVSKRGDYVFLLMGILTVVDVLSAATSSCTTNVLFWND